MAWTGMRPLATSWPPERRSADNATLRLYEDFLECVKAGKKPEASAGRAVSASKTGWLAEVAAQRKAEVKWGDVA